MAKTAAVGCPAEEKGRRKKESQFSQVLGRLRSNKMAMFGLAISLILIVLAIAAPLIMPYKYDQMDMANRFASPSLKHLCGTDEMGRDYFFPIVIWRKGIFAFGVHRNNYFHFFGNAHWLCRRIFRGYGRYDCYAFD